MPSVYVGNWEKGVAQGYGKLTYASDNVYVGNWENDTMHGYGKYIDADGNIYEGEYVEGKLKN